MPTVPKVSELQLHGYYQPHVITRLSDIIFVDGLMDFFFYKHSLHTMYMSLHVIQKYTLKISFVGLVDLHSTHKHEKARACTHTYTQTISTPSTYSRAVNVSDIFIIQCERGLVSAHTPQI